MKTFTGNATPNIRIRWYVLALAMSWTVVLAVSAFLNISHEQEEMQEMARLQARTTLEKDIQYRQWIAGQGGVYVPISAHTPENPYLNKEMRVVTTTDGRQLTLVNPSYMTRQIHEAASKTAGLRGHITSLNPIRPGNEADAWETSALQTFNDGQQEYSEISAINNINYMRLMQPLITEKECLSCHAAQGYKTGDIRGGLSVAIPMAPLMEISNNHKATMLLTHGLVWLSGLLGLAFGAQNLGRHIQLQHQYARELQQYLAAVEGSSDAILITNGSGQSLFLNFAFGQLFGYNASHLKVVDVRKLVDINVREVFDVIGGLEWETECMAQTTQGDHFPCLLRCSEILDVDFKPIGIIWNFLDLSARKQQETERLEHERVKVLIETVGGVCHNINQPLTVLSGYTEILRSHMADDADQVLMVDKMKAATDRIIEITGKLQQVSKYETMQYVNGQIIDIDKASEAD
jgi:PAS domain S-box-containing protein